MPKLDRTARTAEHFDVFDFALTPEVAVIDALDTGDRCSPNPEIMDTKLFPIPEEKQYAWAFR